MRPQIKAIYICVKDMNRATQFYEDIFGIKVSSKDKKMSIFKFSNISFLLFDPKIDNEKIIYGNNAIPGIEVNKIERTLEFIKEKKCKIIMPLRKINEYRIFQAEDTEGNIIEFYTTK